MASSRIFIKGIPPNMSADELKKHFSKQGVVTDAKALGSRRIGYIGYKTTEEATKALKYFNKSYLRMSKLLVEFAQPASQCKAGSPRQSATANRSANEDVYSGLKKRKRQQAKETSTGGLYTVEEVRERLNPDDQLNFGQTTNDGSTYHVETTQSWLQARMGKSVDKENFLQPESEGKNSMSVNDESEPKKNMRGESDDEGSVDTAQEANCNVSGSTDAQNPYKRLFLRNLPYTLTEEDLREALALFGDIDEIHVPVDSSGIGKGFAFVQYRTKEDAKKAHEAMDGTVFHGRLLQILPSEPKRVKFDEFEISKLPLKQQMLIRRKAESSAKSFTWNSLYMNPDTVITYISDRLGVSKSDVLDPSSSNAAIVQARAESHVIEETKLYFQSHGVDLNAFKDAIRGDTTILVKNFVHGTSADELLELFAGYGEISRFLMPPGGVTAIVSFQHVNSARVAFKALSYRRFRESILFLEWAPKNIFMPNSIAAKDYSANRRTAVDGVEDEILTPDAETSTLYIRNLSFSTTNDQLRDRFQGLHGFLSSTIKTRPDPKDSSKLLSMGYGFLEFRTQAQAKSAMDAMQGYNLGGHNLIIKVSHKAANASSERDGKYTSKHRSTKIIVKNLPFEVSKTELRALFASYGQLRSLRIPKKIDRSSRGFAFVEFATSRDAENAMEALKHTHVLGRRLILQLAAEDIKDPEEEIEKIQKKVKSQINKITLDKMTSSKRRKIDLEDVGGEKGL